MILRYNEDTIKNCPFTNVTEYLDPTPHVHTFWEITYPIYDEALVQFVNGKKVETRNDAFLIMKPGDVHAFKAYTPIKRTKLRSIFVDDKKMKSICSIVHKDLYEKLIFSTDPIVVHFASSTNEDIEMRWNIFSHISINEERLKSIHSSLIAYLMGLYVEDQLLKTEGYPGWLSDLLNNLKRADFLANDIEDIVASTNYSHGFVCREFKKYFNQTLVSYVLEERLRKSLIMLMDEEKSAVDIALESGFCSQSSYINSFKKLFNVTPAVWRRNYTKCRKLKVNREAMGSVEEYVK